MARFTLVLTFFLICLASARAEDQPVPAPEKYELKLIYIFEGSNREFIFTLGNSGFRSVESLKQFLGRRPRGTEVTWAPGCKRIGGEPLLSSEEDMKSFREFLEQRGIRFILIPSG